MSRINSNLGVELTFQEEYPNSEEAMSERSDEKTKTARQRYDEFMPSGEEKDPIERLRFFCSLAMNGQDWIDSEPFFDDLIKEWGNDR